MRNKLRVIRAERKMQQIRLARMARIHSATLSQIENELVEPLPRQQEKLAKALGLKIEEIFPAE